MPSPQSKELQFHLIFPWWCYSVPPSQLILTDVTPATRLLDKRRQQFEVDEALEVAKSEYAAKEGAFRAREEVCGSRRMGLRWQAR